MHLYFRFILLVLNIDCFIVAASADIGRAASLRSSHMRPTDEWADRCKPSSSLYFHFLNYWPNEPFDSSWAVEGNWVAARNTRAGFKGVPNFTKGYQSNDEIRDPRSPIPWGPKHFMTPVPKLIFRRLALPVTANPQMTRWKESRTLRIRYR